MNKGIIVLVCSCDFSALGDMPPKRWYRLPRLPHAGGRSDSFSKQTLEALRVGGFRVDSSNVCHGQKMVHFRVMIIHPKTGILD